MRFSERRIWRWLRFTLSVSWLTTFFLLTWPAVAAADNCSTFGDCFGQSGAASEAAFGLTLLAGLSLIIDFIPVVGDGKGLIEAYTGRDLLTGEELADWERAIGVIGLIPGGDLLRLVGRGADAAGGLGAVSRNADGTFTSITRNADGSTSTARVSADGISIRVESTRTVGGIEGPPTRNPGGTPGRAPAAPEPPAPPRTPSDAETPTARPAGDTPDAPRNPGPDTPSNARPDTPTRSPDAEGPPRDTDPDTGRSPESGNPREVTEGSVVAHGTNRPQIDSLADDYADATPSQRTKISEEIGELGAIDHLQEVTGRDVGLLRPTSDADVADLVNRFDDGVAWDEAVAFNGRNVTNVVYFDGQTLHIIEAKGGRGTYGSRVTTATRGTENPVRISQEDFRYPQDVAVDMRNSGIRDGRNAVGDLIEEAYDAGNVQYRGVLTSGHNTGGSPVTTVNRIFTE